MNSNHVDQPHAQLLKEAGWKWETERTHFLVWIVPVRYELRETNRCLDSQLLDYPAPNLSELRERLTWDDFDNYYIAEVFSTENYRATFEPTIQQWFYDVTADPNALAEIWVWVNSNKKGE